MTLANLSNLVGTGFSVAAIYFTGKKSHWGPVLGAVGFVPWTVFALLVHAYPMIALNAVITGLNVQILLRWRREHAG